MTPTKQKGEGMGTIKTKYSLGERVWFMNDNRLDSSTIESIGINLWLEHGYNTNKQINK